MAVPEIQVSVCGRRWRLQFCDDLGDMYGSCDSPDIKRKKIRICSSLQGMLLMDTLIHELLHAAEWDAGENWVDKVATNTAQVLVVGGYERRPPRNNNEAEQRDMQKIVHSCLRIAKTHLDQDRWAEGVAHDIAVILCRLGFTREKTK